MAANVAESVRLNLPPVNFYEIACRYLKQLYLPVEKILPHACRIYEWSMPPDLWLSANELRLPTRVCVMSILIVAIRMLYDINGFGSWEKSSYKKNGAASIANGRFDSESVDTERGSGSPQTDDEGEKPVRNASKCPELGLDSAELLRSLEARYDEMVVKHEYTKDLPSYLQYCKDVVFAGAGPSNVHHRDEEDLIEKLWDFYLDEKISDPAKEVEEQSSPCFYQKRPRDDDPSSRNVFEKKKIKEDHCATPFHDINSCHEYSAPQESLSDGSGSSSHNSLEDHNLERDDCNKAEAVKNEAIRLLKLDMEDNRFCYIPPRVNLKRFDYLHYVRKKDEGALTYVAHADYYILLRACARVAEVDIRIMHTGVLSFERRLAWLEKRIDHCLHLTPPIVTCEFCGNVPDDYSMEDHVALSNLSL